MPIPITCPHCGASYSVADDLLGRKMLCRECDQSLVVEGTLRLGRRRSPLQFVLVAVVLLLALMPTAALGGLWWTGWLYDQLEWPTPAGILNKAPNETILLRVCGLERLNADQNIQDEIAV